MATKWNLYAPASIDRGHIILPVSVCMSAENLTYEPNVSFNFHTIQVTVLIFGMQVAFDNTQLHRVNLQGPGQFLTLILKTLLEKLTCELNIFL